jgi:hypothetical protein
MNNQPGGIRHTRGSWYPGICPSQTRDTSFPRPGYVVPPNSVNSQLTPSARTKAGTQTKTLRQRSALRLERSGSRNSKQRATPIASTSCSARKRRTLVTDRECSRPELLPCKEDGGGLVGALCRGACSIPHQAFFITGEIADEGLQRTLVSRLASSIPQL